MIPSGNRLPILKRKSSQSAQVLGLWDLRAEPVTLGGLLFMVEELLAQAVIHDAEMAGVCFIGDLSHRLPRSESLLDDGAMRELDSVTCAHSVLLSMLLDLQGVKACYLAKSLTAVKDFVSQKPSTYLIWPSLDAVDEEGQIKHAYGTTFFLQQFYKKHGWIPSISMKPRHTRWALDFIENHVAPFLPVVVHLKNNPNEVGCSNAKFEAWLNFFESSIDRYEVKFVLIGNEAIDERIEQLPNVVVTQALDGTLSRDLALIQVAYLFMGMSSGPCNMALFSDVSYVIYKNPDHHPEQMALELGEADHFPFATPFQRFLRVFETKENLISAFHHLYTHLNRQAWEQRLAKLREVGV